MTGNNETLEQIRVLLSHRELTGQLILHCRRGLIEVIDVTERVQPKWKDRVNGREVAQLRDL